MEENSSNNQNNEKPNSSNSSPIDFLPDIHKNSKRPPANTEARKDK